MLSVIEKALFLKQVELFKSMGAELLKILANIAEEMHFEKGELLFEERAPADYLYVIVEGEVEILKNPGCPQEFRFVTLGARASFGEMALFGDERRSAAARIATNATLLGIRKEALLFLLQENPVISVAIIQQLASIIRGFNEAKDRLAASHAGADPEKRRYDRHAIPLDVRAPAISESPIIARNLSQGGLLLETGRMPDPDAEFALSFWLQDVLFEWGQARVAWVQQANGSPGRWSVGVEVDLSAEERSQLRAALKNPGE